MDMDGAQRIQEERRRLRHRRPAGKDQDHEDDDDEELLRFQQQFLQSGGQSTAKVRSKKVAKEEEETPQPQPVKRDVVQLGTAPLAPNDHQTHQNHNEKKRSRFKSDVAERGHHTGSAQPWVLKSVLRERRPTAGPPSASTYHPLPEHQDSSMHRNASGNNVAFPVAEHRDTMGVHLGRRRQRRQPHQNAMEKLHEAQKKQEVFSRSFAKNRSARPVTAAGTMDPTGEEIDRASDQMLENMTPEQLEEAMMELRGIRADLLQGLKMRAEKNKRDGTETEGDHKVEPLESISEERDGDNNNNGKQMEIRELQHPSGPLPHVVGDLSRQPFFQADKKLQKLMMTDEEYMKLQWMTDAEALSTGEQVSGNVLEARFDFEGQWIDSKREEELSNRNELLHHGKDPHKPGYTLEEIVKFGIRSSVTGQRIIHLGLFANVLAVQQHFDHIVDIINFTLRERSIEMLAMLMSDRNMNVSLAALKCFYTLCSVITRYEGRTLEYHEALSRHTFRGESVYSVNFDHLSTEQLQNESNDQVSENRLLPKLREIRMSSEKNESMVPLEQTTLMQIMHILISAQETVLLDRLAALLLLQMQSMSHGSKMQENMQVILNLILDLLLMTYCRKTCSLTMVNQFVKNKILIQTLLDVVFGISGVEGSSKMKMFKILTSACLYSRQFTMEFLSDYNVPSTYVGEENMPVLQMCKRYLLSFQPLDENSEEDTLTLQIDTEILRFLAVCVSYGFAWEVCHQSCFAALTKMVRYAFKGSGRADPSSIDLACAVFYMLQNFVLASVDPSNVRSSNAADKDTDNIAHLRFFVENECLVLLERVMTSREDLNRLHLHASMLHFAASYYQRLPATSSHMQHISQSIKMIEGVFAREGLLQSLDSMIVSSHGALVSRNETTLPFKHRLTCTDALVSVLRFAFCMANILPPLHTTMMKELQQSLGMISNVIEVQGVHTLKKALQKNGYRKMHYRIELWLDYYFFKFVTFSASVDPKFDHAIMSSAIRTVDRCIWAYADYDDGTDTNEQCKPDAAHDWPSEDIVILSDALVVLLHKRYPLLHQYFRIEFGLHNLSLRSDDFSALKTQFEQYAIQSHCMMSVTHEAFSSTSGADSLWPFSVVKEMFRLQHRVFLSDGSRHTLQQDQHVRLLVEQLTMIDTLEKNRYFTTKSSPPVMRLANLTMVYLMHQSSINDSVLYFQEPEIERLMQSLLVHFYRSSLGNAIKDGKLRSSWRFDPFGHLSGEKKTIMEERFSSMFESLMQQFNVNSYGNKTFTYYVTLMMVTALWPVKFQRQVINEICMSNASIFLRMKSLIPSIKDDESELANAVKEAFLAQATNTRELAENLAGLLLQVGKDDDIEALAAESSRDLSLLDYAVHHVQSFVWCLDMGVSSDDKTPFSYPLDRFQVMKDMVTLSQNDRLLQRVLIGNSSIHTEKIWHAFLDRLDGPRREQLTSKLNDMGLMIA